MTTPSLLFLAMIVMSFGCVAAMVLEGGVV